MVVFFVYFLYFLIHISSVISLLQCIQMFVPQLSVGTTCCAVSNCNRRENGPSWCFTAEGYLSLSPQWAKSEEVPMQSPNVKHQVLFGMLGLREMWSVMENIGSIILKRSSHLKIPIKWRCWRRVLLLLLSPLRVLYT